MEDVKVKGYRQGEILFIPISKETSGTLNFFKNLNYVTSPKGDNIIREGEITGHMHEVTSKGAKLFNIKARWQLPSELSGDMYLTSDNKIVIKHPEHKDLELDKGDYIIRIQREYDEAENRRVLD